MGDLTLCLNYIFSGRNVAHFLNAISLSLPFISFLHDSSIKVCYEGWELLLEVLEQPGGEVLFVRLRTISLTMLFFRKWELHDPLNL